MSHDLVIPLMAVLSMIGPSTCDDMRIIESPMITTWGDWGLLELCPDGNFVQAAQLKLEPMLGSERDDSALNGIRLYCGDPTDPETPTITSTVGPWGNWLPVFMTCPNNLNAFELKVEPRRSSGDNGATSNARFQCIENEMENPHKLWYEVKEQPGIDWTWGSWTGMQSCELGYAICGIQTQVERELGQGGDNTALNNVKIACCDVNQIPILFSI